jgi:hypothetical protein
MKEITIKAYEFHELSEKAQKRVLEKYSDINVNDDYWHDPYIEEFKEDLKNWGVTDPEIGYSGFWSQGDGACFAGGEIDEAKLLQTMRECSYFDVPHSWLNAAVEGSLTIRIVKFNHRYEHSKTIHAKVDYIGEVLSKDEEEDMETVITGWAQDMSDQLYRSLEKGYDSLQTEDAVIEEITAREWVFTESGQRISILV